MNASCDITGRAMPSRQGVWSFNSTCSAALSCTLRPSELAGLYTGTGLLRAVRRGRRKGTSAARHHADDARLERRRAGCDGWHAGAFDRELPGEADPPGRGRGDCRANGRLGHRQGAGRTQGDAGGDARRRHRIALLRWDALRGQQPTMHVGEQRLAARDADEPPIRVRERRQALAFQRVWIWPCAISRPGASARARSWGHVGAAGGVSSCVVP